MGIQGLLPFVKKACHCRNIHHFKNQVVAVDASCWLHKGGFGCCDKLATGIPTDFYVRYCLKFVKVLLASKMHVILVFDGQSLPAKKDVEVGRKQRRQKMKEKGLKLQAEGKTDEARECFKQCVQITTEMVTAVIEACSNLPNVDCLVAPYESDAQLAYLQKAGIAQLIITEDSDLIAFGCDKILFKMNDGGQGMLYDKSLLPKCLNIADDKFNFEKFRRLCILSGCDYIDSLPGIGLVKASKFIAKTCSSDLRRILPKLPVYLRMTSVKVSTDYIDAFINAENAFLYQVVYDPVLKQQRHLNELDPDDVTLSDISHCGVIEQNSQIASDKAMGLVDRYDSNKRLSNLDQNTAGTSSIHSGDFDPNLIDLEQTTKKAVVEKTAFQATTQSRSVKVGQKVNLVPPVRLTQNKSTPDLLELYGANVSRMNGHLNESIERTETSVTSRFFDLPSAMFSPVLSPCQVVSSNSFTESQLVDHASPPCSSSSLTFDEEMFEVPDVSSKKVVSRKPLSPAKNSFAVVTPKRGGGKKRGSILGEILGDSSTQQSGIGDAGSSDESPRFSSLTALISRPTSRETLVPTYSISPVLKRKKNEKSPLSPTQAVSPSKDALNYQNGISLVNDEEFVVDLTQEPMKTGLGSIFASSSTLQGKMKHSKNIHVSNQCRVSGLKKRPRKESVSIKTNDQQIKISELWDKFAFPRKENAV